ncbi:MAG: hypothetical protein Q8O79_09390 [Pseudomonadota bacterium]|nr:hypothetical protein [Pseudomonadota bacterium]
MPHTDNAALGQEWIALQNNHEQYEKGALLIKLLAVVLCAVGFALALHEVLIGALLLVLWLQEGIYRTSQARLGVRILRIEQGLKTGENAAFQLHSEWLASRPGLFGLLAEYAASALRPTVAFPYAVLLLMIVLLVVLAGV